MKIVLDTDKCTGLGICESLAPEFFEVGDDGELVLKRSDVPGCDVADVETAVNSCPTEALRIEN